VFVLNGFGLLLTTLFVLYVATILVPYLRRKPNRPGNAGDFQWHFIVPCRDEDAVIENTLHRLRSSFPEAHVWVVDDASQDATVAKVSAVVARDPKVHLARRYLPDARVGKGAALNTAYRALDAWLGDADRSTVIVGVVDADGVLGADTLALVAGADGFGSPQTGAAQICVRMINRDERRPVPHGGLIHNEFARTLIRMQDQEFATTIGAMQMLRMKTGSVGLGGNGQFIRLATLDELTRQFGEPWHGALLEDYELGLHTMLAGWKVAYLHDAYVEQEALISVRRLITQRVRWAQGNMQCVRYVPRIIRCKHFPMAGALEASYFLVLPFIQVIGIALGAIAAVGVAVRFAAEPHTYLTWFANNIGTVLAVLLLFGVAPFVVWGPIYRKRYAPAHSWWRGLQWGTANWLYTAYIPISSLRAVYRFATGKSTWAKTKRNAEGGAVPHSDTIQPTSSPR
jgi:1,2-diacylglycerol 3-beta-glucosyltransferase